MARPVRPRPFLRARPEATKAVPPRSLSGTAAPPRLRVSAAPRLRVNEKGPPKGAALIRLEATA